MSVRYWNHTLYVLLFNLVLVFVLHVPHVHIVIRDNGWNDFKVTTIRARTTLYYMGEKSAQTCRDEQITPDPLAASVPVVVEVRYAYRPPSPHHRPPYCLDPRRHPGKTTAGWSD